MLGDIWTVSEGVGETEATGPTATMMAVGYDPARSRFVGTWLGSMMTHLWVYEGSLDDSGKVLTLNSEGPDFHREGKMAPYRDIIEIIDADHRLLRSATPDESGQWQVFMTADYRRVQ